MRDRFVSDKNGLNRLLIIISSFRMLKCIPFKDGTVECMGAEMENNGD